MDGSQLPTEWSHLNSDLVAGVSDSKMRDASNNKSATASKKGLMTQKDEDVKKNSIMGRNLRQGGEQARSCTYEGKLW